LDRNGAFLLPTTAFSSCKEAQLEPFVPLLLNEHGQYQETMDCALLRKQAFEECTASLEEMTRVCFPDLLMAEPSFHRAFSSA
jgi:hypothetical protein